MRRNPHLVLLLVALVLLLASAGAGAQLPRSRLGPNEFAERRRTAIEETARFSSPEAIEKLQKAFGIESYSSQLEKKMNPNREANSLRKLFEGADVFPSIEQRGGQKVLILTPTSDNNDRPNTIEKNDRPNTIRQMYYNHVMRPAREIMLRDEVIHRIELSDVTPLEGIRRKGENQSDLEAELQKLGVRDHEEVARSFDALAQAKRGVLKNDVSLVRIVGGGSKPLGRYLFCCMEAPANAPGPIQGPGVSADSPVPPRNRGSEPSHWIDSRGLATPPGNTEEQLAVVKLPAGTVVFVGPIASNFGDRQGGNIQVFVPDQTGELIGLFPLMREKPAQVTSTDVKVIGSEATLWVRRSEPAAGGP